MVLVAAAPALETRSRRDRRFKPSRPGFPKKARSISRRQLSLTRYDRLMRAQPILLPVVLATILVPRGQAAEKGNPASEDDPRPPNLLLVVTDDQRLDALGHAGHPILKTPHMDALAAGGCWFTSAFVSTPICAASRASILTGQWERAHGYTFGAPPLGQEAIAHSYPSRLRQAGYRTGFVGKLGVKVVKGATAEMFDVFRPSSRPYVRDDRAEGRHLTELHADWAIEFLRGNDPEQPFCLSISFHAPHAEDGNPDQYVWPKSCDELYTEAELPPPPTSDPEFFDALPKFLRESLNRERWHWRFDTPEKHARMVKGYYRMISGVDVALGRILKELEERGFAANTVVMLIGDNGYFLGERGYAGKWSMHDLSTRVPLIILDPRVTPERRAQTVEQFVLNVDLAPTLLELAGVPVPSDMQGRSLHPLLDGESAAWREEVVTEHLWKLPSIPRTEALRTRRWKYIRYLDHPEFEELYDLEEDPREEHNLAGSTLHADRLRSLRERLERQEATLGPIPR